MSVKSRLANFISFVLVLWTASAHSFDVDQVIKEMPIEHKVAQLLIFGFSGTEMRESLTTQFREIPVGGLIAFRRNIKSHDQISQLNLELQNLSLSISRVPLLLMVDQEGGQVSRIRTRPPTPSALALGSAEDPRITEEVGFITGKILQGLGFNMNLAPVLDLSDAKKLTFVGNRSFGATQEIVSEQGLSFSRGLVKAGIIPTAKHFPGHGKTDQDSHKLLPSRDVSLDYLRSHDLVPFEKFIAESKPGAIMIAHLKFPKLDPSGLPATFSKTIITELLREKLRFDGIILTDDLEMAATMSMGNIGIRAEKALLAGSDLIMVAWNPRDQRSVYNYLLSRVKSGAISEERINQSLRRILIAKKQIWTSFSDLKVARENLTLNMTEMESRLQDVKISLAKKSINNLKESTRIRTKVSSKLFVYTSDPEFFRSFSQEIPKMKTVLKIIGPKIRNSVREDLMQKGSLGVFYVTGAGSARQLRGLPSSTKGKLIVINGFDQASVQSEKHLDVVNLFSPVPESGRLLGEWLNLPSPEERVISSEQAP